MAQKQTTSGKLKDSWNKVMADKVFLMKACAGLTLLLIMALWLLSLRSSLSSTPPGTKITDDLQFEDLKQKFNASWQEIDQKLQALDAKKNASSTASSTLNQNMNSLLDNSQAIIDNKKASTTAETLDASSTATSSLDQNIDSLKANLLDIETKLK
jgi:hypothetical protein